MSEDFVKFVRTGTAFVVILCLVLAVVNELYIHLVSKEKLEYKRQEAFKKQFLLHQVNLSSAFFGNSHPQYAIMPEWIPNSYNFGGAYTPIDTYYTLVDLLAANVKINRIFLQLDAETYSSQNHVPDIVNRLETNINVMPQAELETLYGQSYSTLWIQSKLPALGAGEDFNTVQGPRTPIKDGWLNNPKDFSSLSDNERSMAAAEIFRNHFNGIQRAPPLELEYLQRTMRLAKEKNISVIFIKYPVSDEYWSNFDKTNITISNTEYYGILNNTIAQVLGADYTMLDYVHFFSGRDDLFGDPHHLNFRGAAILSKKVAEDIQNVST